jgi:hypothetical protein
MLEDHVFGDHNHHSPFELIIFKLINQDGLPIGNICSPH